MVINATELQAERAIVILKRAINAAENSNQAGENAVVIAANSLSLLGDNITNETETTTMTITSDKYSAEMIQQARDIVADAFVAQEAMKGKKPLQYDTYAAWGKHIDNYSQYMRDGAYDDDLAIQSTLVALASVAK